MKNKPYLQKNTAEDSMHKKSIPTFYLNLKKEIQDVEQKKPIKVQQLLKENAIKDNRSYFTGYNKNGVPTFHLKIDPKKAREDYLKQNKEVINQYPEERIVISSESTSEEVNNSNIPLHYYRSVEKKAPAGVIDSSQDVQQLNKQKKLYNAILDKDDSVNNVCKKKSNLKSKMPDSSKADSQSNVKINNIPVFRMDISKNIKQSNQNVPVVKIDISQDVQQSNKLDAQQSNKLSVKQSNRQEMIYGKILDNDFDCKKDNPKNQVNQIKFQQFSPNCFGKTKS